MSVTKSYHNDEDFRLEPVNNKLYCPVCGRPSSKILVKYTLNGTVTYSWIMTDKSDLVETRMVLGYVCMSKEEQWHKEKKEAMRTTIGTDHLLFRGFCEF